MRQIYKPLLGLLTALLACIPVLAYDFSAPNADGVILYYNIISETDKTVEVAQNSTNEYSGDIVIPEKVDYNGITYSVRSIRRAAFYSCTSLTSVAIPNSVTTIGSRAFRNCTGLTQIMIGNSVTEIGDEAFAGCPDLSAFYGKFASEDNRCLIVDGRLCAFAPNGVTSYSIPNSVTTIGDWAFAGYSGLTSVTIPNSVTTIGDYAFAGCSGLTQVIIGNSIKEIDAYAFLNCPNLSAFYGKLASDDNRCIIVDGRLCAFAPNGVISYSIPNFVTTIGHTAFAACSNLTSVDIPNSVTAIGANVFFQCYGLASVTIPASVTEIGEYAFYGTNLASVTIPNSVTEIGDWLFGGCINLTSIKIPDSVTTIGSYAFWCTNLASVTIPNSVTEIGDNAFSQCYGLASVTIGNSVTEIGDKAFFYCTSLSTVYAKPLVPPVCRVSNEYNNDVFYYVDKTTATLYVPQESLEAYKAADTWREFFNIEADTASITEVAEDEDSDAPAVYYDLNGIRVERPESGNLYILQRGEKTQKIVY